MRILAIETSCDETAIAIVEAEGSAGDATFRILGNALLSQVELHAKYGGVYPNLAKREHAKNLVPILAAALEEAGLLVEERQELSQDVRDTVAKTLEREPALDETTLAFLSETERPALDAIAVTAGPGLEPALWVGINFAKALSLAWSVPIVAANHMEGHVLAALATQDGKTLAVRDTELPVLALLISGGHTELVLMRDWLSYELIGRTRDDAVGEAFDKVARMLDLPYPGGPAVSKLAEEDREDEASNPFRLPRPMIHEDTCDFSFAGLKTAVLYLLKGREPLSPMEKRQLAREFEDAVADVLWSKTERALEKTGAKTLAVGGGVSANAHIRRVFERKAEESSVALRIPEASLTTDNALMIAMAGYLRALRTGFTEPDALRANGNLHLASG